MGVFSPGIIRPAPRCKSPPCREERRLKSKPSPTFEFVPEIVPIAIAFLIGAVLGWLGGWLSKRNRPPQPDSRLEEELRRQLRLRGEELDSARAKFTETSGALSAAEANRK